MSNPRTLRSEKLRDALYRSTDGKCAICGIDLPNNWHADHVVPWSETHMTNVHEMQPTCPACNLAKGARMASLKLREHQQQFDKYIGDLNVHDLPKTVLLHVTPGGGKSLIPQIIKKHFPGLKIAWFVPRRSLLRQAARSCMAGKIAKMRLVELEGFEVNPSKGEDGFVATHNALAQNPEGFRQELARHDYALVIDEAHHGKADPRTEVAQPVGAAFKALYRAARLRVDLSGTLETADGKLIVGLGYREDGAQLVPDAERSHDKVIRYTRAQAIRDHAVVPVAFDHHDGEVEWKEDAEQFKGTLSDMPKDKLGKALWVALRSDIADKMFLRGVAHWRENSNGKLIVVADRQDNATTYAKRLRGMGIECSLAIDDNADAEADVRRFLDERTGNDAPTRAMVTCQMAYEGLDVPSATHLICLTHIRSAPWIEQMLGRIWRATDDKSVCHAFVPDDPVMNEVIERIRREEMSGVAMGEEREKREGAAGQLGLIYDIGGIMTNVRTTELNGDTVVNRCAVTERSAVTAARMAIANLTAEERAALLAEQMGSPSKAPAEETPAEQRKALRDRLTDLTRNVAVAVARRNSMKPDWQQPFAWLMAQTGKSVKHMTIDELKKAMRLMEGYLAQLAS